MEGWKREEGFRVQCDGRQHRYNSSCGLMAQPWLAWTLGQAKALTKPDI